MFAGMMDAQKNPNFGSQQDRDFRNSPYTSNQLNGKEDQEKLNSGNSLASPDDGHSKPPGSPDGNQSGATAPTQQQETAADTATTYDSVNQPGTDSQAAQQTQQETEQAVYGPGNGYQQEVGSQTSQQAQQQQTEQAVYGSNSPTGAAHSRSNSPGKPAETRTLGDVIRGSTVYGSRQSTAQDGRFAFLRTAYQIGHNTAAHNIQRGQQNIQRLRQMGAPQSRPAPSAPSAPPVPGTRYLNDNNSKKEDRR